MNMICPHCGKDFSGLIEQLGVEAMLWHLAIHSGEMAQKIADLEDEIELLKRITHSHQEE